MTFNKSFNNVYWIIRYRRSKDDPVTEERKSTAEAAYQFALEVETNGGITIVLPSATTKIPPVPPKKLTFEE